MNVLFFLAAKAPKDLWTIIINWIQGALGNYGWTILLFTILVKLVMSPLDFMVKYSTKKQTLVQKKCSPQIAKLKKKFGSNQEQLRIQTQAIYKREGLKMGTSCIIMLVNLIFTWVIFFTLFGSLREVSAYEVINQYETIEQSYTDTYVTELNKLTGNESIVDEKSANDWLATLDETNPDHQVYLDYHTEAGRQASKAALSTWKDVKEDWLWVENIWVADATTSPLPSYDKLISIAKDGGYKTYVEENIDKDKYTAISSYIAKHAPQTKNGYFIIPILVGLLTFLSQLITELHSKLRNKKAQHLAKATADATSSTSMKMMKIIMPIIMVFFAFSSSASFGIYLLASSLASMAIGEVVSLIINKLTKKQQKEVEEVLEKEANRLIKKGKLQEK